MNIEHLIDGYKSFRTHYFENPNNTLFETLSVEGQSPKFLIIGCCDSRVDPSILLESSPGDLFVVRNIANLVPPCDKNPKYHGTSAALEFAVKVLKVDHIILLGHTQCGGIQELLSHPCEKNETTFIGSWLKLAEPARIKVLSEFKDASPEEQAKLCEQEALRISLRNLHTFPWVEERINEGTLSVHAWHFNLSTGVIQKLNKTGDRFEDLDRSR